MCVKALSYEGRFVVPKMCQPHRKFLLIANISFSIQVAMTIVLIHTHLAYCSGMCVLVMLNYRTHLSSVPGKDMLWTSVKRGNDVLYMYYMHSN